MNRIIYLLPALTICALLYLQIKTTIDARTITLISDPVPYFEIEEMSFLSNRKKTISSDNIKDYIDGDLLMVNFFATWCSTCLLEHNELMSLAEEYNVKIIGIAFKDEPKDIKLYMTDFGNPYTHIALDKDGYAAAGWKIAGTPESFFIDTSGKIRYHYRGPIRNKNFPRILQVIETIRNNMANESGQT